MFYKNRISQKQIKSKSQILIGLPANETSTAMVKAIQNLLSLHQEVRAAYLFMKGTAEENPVLTLGILFHNNAITYPEVFSSVGLVIESYLSEAENMDMISLKDDNIYQIVKHLDGSLIYPI